MRAVGARGAAAGALGAKLARRGSGGLLARLLELLALHVELLRRVVGLLAAVRTGGGLLWSSQQEEGCGGGWKATAVAAPTTMYRKHRPSTITCRI